MNNAEQQKDILVLEVAGLGSEVVAISGEVMMNGYRSGEKISIWLVSSMPIPSQWGIRKSDITHCAAGNRKEIVPLDIIRVVVRQQPFNMHNGDQNENWIWNLAQRWSYIGRLALEFMPILYGEQYAVGNNPIAPQNVVIRNTLADRPENLWLFRDPDDLNDCVIAENFAEARQYPSIYTIEPKNYMFRKSIGKLRATFKYNGQYYDFTVKDNNWIAICDGWLRSRNIHSQNTDSFEFPHGRAHLFTVSLLTPFRAQGWTHDARFKVIASIITLY